MGSCVMLILNFTRPHAITHTNINYINNNNDDDDDDDTTILDTTKYVILESFSVFGLTAANI